VVNRLLVVPAVAPRRHLGGHRRGAAGAGADQGRARPRAERGDPRQPVGQDHGKGGPRGYDGGKKVAGRKRSLLVDTGGLVLARRVDPADVPDREGAKRLLAPLKGHLPRLAKVWMDGGYKGEFEAWLAQELGWAAEVVRQPDAGIRHVWLPAGAPPPEPRPKGFRLLPRRWVVERTFAWLGRNRRLAKDHEGRCETGEAWIDLAMIRLLASRLARRRLSTQLLRSSTLGESLDSGSRRSTLAPNGMNSLLTFATRTSCPRRTAIGFYRLAGHGPRLSSLRW